MKSRYIIVKIIDYAKVISWSIAVFFYYFQVPFMEQAWMITTGLAFFLLFNFNNIFNFINERKELVFAYLCLFIFCLLNAAYSNYMGAEITNIIRFFLIVVLIPILPIVERSNNVNLYTIFTFFSFCKAIMIIVIAYIVVSTGSYAEMRTWAQLNHYGDVYILYDNIPRVQLKGNALLVLAFMISFVKTNKITLYSFVLLISILLAGNFAFILALTIFFLWQYFIHISLNKITVKKIFFTLIVFLYIIGFTGYTLAESENKSGSPNSSNAHRIEQIEILSDTNYFIGNGLGSIVKEAAAMGVPIDSQYYEVQTMYIFFQVGLIILCLFYIILFVMAKNHYNYYGNIILFIYLIYSFFNPYCFDSTQMIAMILIAIKFSI